MVYRIRGESHALIDLGLSRCRYRYRFTIRRHGTGCRPVARLHQGIGRRIEPPQDQPHLRKEKIGRRVQNLPGRDLGRNTGISQ